MDLPLPLDDLLDLYERASTVAVVGASTDEHKQAHRIPSYLQSQGYRIIPVSPRREEILGERPVPSLAEVAGPIHVVDVFRPAEEAPEIARQAVAIGADVLWLQLGIISEEAARIAKDGGLTVVMNACMGAIHKKLRRSHGLGQ